jgi:hypothetical protein
MDNPLYRLHFEPGDSKEIVDDDFDGAYRIPHSVAIQYAKKHKHILKITEKELSDNEYIEYILGKLVDEFGKSNVYYICNEVGITTPSPIKEKNVVEVKKSNEEKEVSDILNVKSVKKTSKKKSKSGG